jgi:hypothetical protein
MMRRMPEAKAVERLDALAAIGRPVGNDEAAAVFDLMFCEVTWELGVDVPLDEALALRSAA